MITAEPDIILEFKDVTKSFPGVDALKGVSFTCRAGEVHALIGENGAGKSTLMKCLSGVHQTTSGEIIYQGGPLKVKNPHEAQDQGISIIYQEFSLIRNFTIWENVYINREPCGPLGFVSRKRARQQTRDLLNELGIELDVDRKVKDLTVVQQQVVEIVKALSVTAKVVIMDEPSATLTDNELKKLFMIIKALKAKNVTVIYISHRLEEVFEICDRATVLKDGQVMTTLNVVDTSKDELIRHMVGREISDIFPPLAAETGEVIFAVKDLNLAGELSDISFEVRAGEVLGVAGIVGAGRTQLARCLLGIDPRDSGEIQVKGRVQQLSCVENAIECGLGYLPEDRKNLGILGPMNIRENVTICTLPNFAKYGLLSHQQESRAAQDQADLLSIKIAGLHQPIENLSGGNQQKVLISRWLLNEPDVFIFSEPTRGIDVGAKQEIFRIMREVVGGGKAVIMISSELPEIIGMSDRIMVMRGGRVEGFLDQSKRPAEEEEIMSLAVGHHYSIHLNNRDNEHAAG